MPKVNEADLAWTERGREETTMRRKQLGAAAGGEDLGASLFELPPGNRSWPYHYHEANEEAIYVLAGAGTIRLVDGEQPLEAGDYVALPTGEDGGHRVINDGDEPLRYLVISTMNDPDVAVYPEMDKVGIYTGDPPGRKDDRKLTRYYPLDGDVPYWPEDEADGD